MSEVNSLTALCVERHTGEHKEIRRKELDLSSYYSPFPFKVTWDITHKCNLRCEHCFVIFQKHTETQAAEYEHHLAVARSIASARPFLVSIAGGEPFTIPHLAKVIEIFLTSDSQVIIATNGTIDNPDLMNTLSASGKVSLQVSLDGASAMDHDAIRGPGSFDKSISFLKKYSAHFPTVVAVTLTDTVCNTLEKILALSSDCGASVVKLQKFIITPSVPNAGLAPSQKSLITVQEAIKNTYKSSRGILLIHPFDEETSPTSCGQKSTTCGIGLRECTITPRGHLALCGAVLDQCDLQGNLKTIPLEKLWKELISKRPTVAGIPGACLCTL